MKQFLIKTSIGVVVFLACSTTLPQQLQADDTALLAAACDDESSLYCPVQSTQTLATTLSNFSPPNIVAPKAPLQTVTYDVITRGTITADFAIFKANANATLNDSRGWSQLGVHFAEATSGGQFTLVLSEASQVPSFSSGCSALYSCRAGRYVIINQDRWLGATDAWNNAGGSLRDYQHSVVNHEVGHWLGHDHPTCSGAGNLAAVMQQQSIALQGCKINSWPLKSELWSSTLGIAL
jgi:hypothetical protein